MKTVLRLQANFQAFRLAYPEILNADRGLQRQAHPRL